MDRTNFFFRQIVTEAELDLAFDQVEQAGKDHIADFDTVGIIAGGDLTEVGVPNLTVDVGAPLVGRDQFGNRIYAASVSPVDISVDSNLISTDVSGPGKEKYVSVFVQYDVTLSDERIDGNSNSVYWLQTESYTILVVQGAEADSGLASPTALLPDALLLGDVLRYDGQTQVLNADIDLSRQQVTFSLSTVSFDIAAGTLKEAAQGILQAVEDHIAEVGVAHNASAITFTDGSGGWADASGIAALDVQGAINEIVNDLSAAAGAARVGCDPTGQKFVGTDIQSALAEFPTLAAANIFTNENRISSGLLVLGGRRVWRSHVAGSWETNFSVSDRSFAEEAIVPAAPYQISIVITNNLDDQQFFEIEDADAYITFHYDLVVYVGDGFSVGDFIDYTEISGHFIVRRVAGVWTVIAQTTTQSYATTNLVSPDMVVSGGDLAIRLTYNAAHSLFNTRVGANVSARIIALNA